MRMILLALLILALAVPLAFAVPLLPNVLTPRTPGAKTDNCVKGAVWYDNNYVYWCYADNNIRRVGYDNTW